MEWLGNIDPLEIARASGETLGMVAASLVASIALGLPLGVWLSVTSPSGLSPHRGVYAALSFGVNVLRSIPFVILFILLIPVTLTLVGTSLGVRGAIPPLVVGAAPFFARLVENALREVDRSVIEASRALGASKRQIVLQALLPEALPSLIVAATVTAIALVSYTAMAGVVGAGGLGDLAVRYGYQRFQTDVMVVTVVLIIALVQGLQGLGDGLVARFARK
ncbi:metal ABC transporter permease [Asticcacaulis sp. YBE204]|nr:metal ABC transporter permease [Asticcacaulis sp. YBE204]